MIARLIDNESVEGVAVLDRKAKRCSCCGQIKPIEEFYRDKSRAGGRRSRCKLCDRSRKKINIYEGVIEPEQKKCSVCKIIKNIGEFYRSKRRPDGRQRICKSCTYAATNRRQREIAAFKGGKARNDIVVESIEQVDSLVREMAEIQISIDREVAACRKRVACTMQESARVLEPLRRRQANYKSAITCYYLRNIYSHNIVDRRSRFGLLTFSRGKLDVELDVKQAEKCLDMP